MASHRPLTRDSLESTRSSDAHDLSDEQILDDEDPVIVPSSSTKPKGRFTHLLRNTSERGDPNSPRSDFDSGRTWQESSRSSRRLLYNAENDEDADDDDIAHEEQDGFDEETLKRRAAREDEKQMEQWHRENKASRKWKILHGVLGPILFLGILIALLSGAYRLSKGSPSVTNSGSASDFQEELGIGNQPASSSHQEAQPQSNIKGPITILISLDGFRADFLNRGLTPNLNSLIAQGVSPEYMLPSFPSLTFPNHWTLMTGLYPESHGVVGNTFWDPVQNAQFFYTDPEKSMKPQWWTSTGAEPLWATIKQHGLRSAIHMWPGSEAGIIPEPDIVDKYNGKEPLDRKVDRVMSLLDLPDSVEDGNIDAHTGLRPAFIAMYVPDVDRDGHLYGPNSTEIRATIQSVDTMVGKIVAGLDQKGLSDKVNVIVVSDHGMATTSYTRLYQLEDLLDPEDIAHIDGWPLYGLRPKAGVTTTVLFRDLKEKISTLEPNSLEVYLREEIPERYHFRNSERIAPLWLIPYAGWGIVKKDEFDVAKAREEKQIYHPRGLHGYDNQHPLMRAIFIAKGPAFRDNSPNTKVDVFANTEVYNIVCDTLGVTPKANNGTIRLPFRSIGQHSPRPFDQGTLDFAADELAQNSTTDEQVPPEDLVVPVEATGDEDGRKVIGVDNPGTEPEDEDNKEKEKPHKGFLEFIAEQAQKLKHSIAEALAALKAKLQGGGKKEAGEGDGS